MHLKREMLLLVSLSNHKGSTDQVLLFNKTIQGQEQHYDEDRVHVSYIFLRDVSASSYSTAL